MQTLTFADLVATANGGVDLGFVRSRLHAPVAEPWETFSRAPLTEQERADLAALRRRLSLYTTGRINEATLWARAIYPLLMVAEVDDVRAWSQVPLSVVVRRSNLRGLAGGDLRLHGVVDGALAADAAGQPVEPFFLVIEAKRALDAIDPLPQLQGAMLTLALRRLEDRPEAPCDVYGCFTIGDAWTFLRGRFTLAAADAGTFDVAADYVPSREFSEHAEADQIASVLKSVVALQRPAVMV
jgi:hypothetical protein